MSFSKTVLDHIEKNSIAVLSGLLIFVGIVIYFDFLSFHKFFVAQDIASDQLRYYLPRYVFEADRLWSWNFSSWSFQFGLGQNVYDIVFNLNVFDRLLTLFGRNGLLYAFPYITVLKHIAAGILFFIYLRLLKISPYSAIIGAMLFAYSGFMVVQGQWYRHQDYAIFMVALLIAFEMWFQKGKWIGLALVLGILSLKQILTVFHLPFVIGIYALFRYVQTHPFSLRPFISFSLRLCGICLVGLGINAYELLPSIYHHLTSPRTSLGLDHFGSFSTLSSFFNFSTASDYLSVLYRFFSSDLIGTMNDYRGILNTLEGPNVYAGVILLLLLPQICHVFKKERAKPFWILVVFLVCYFVFPSVKMFLNAFVKYTYKSTVLYAVLLSLIIASSVLNRMMEIRHLNRTNLLATVTVLCVFLVTSFAACSFLNTVLFDEKVFKIILLLLFLYGFLFMLLPKHRFDPKVKVVLLAVVVFELAALSHISVNTNRLHIDKHYIKSRQGCFDHSKSAVDSLREIDGGFFRIEKDYMSDSANDPLLQNYYGTSVYTPFGQSSHILFAQEFNSPIVDTKWILGLKSQPGLMSLVGVKYYLSKFTGVNNVPYGFQHFKTFNDIHIYENTHHLPLGFAYDTYIPYEAFRSLSEHQKERVVSKAVVVNDDYTVLKKLDTERFKAQFNFMTLPLSPDNIKVENVFTDKANDRGLLSYRFFVGDSRIFMDLSETALKEKVLLNFILDSQYSGQGRISYGNRNSGFDETKAKPFAVYKGKVKYQIELPNYDPIIDSLRLDFPDNRGDEIRISDIDIETMDFAFNYADDIQHLRENELNIVSFEEDHIRGTITVDTDSLLFLSIPHDDGWMVHVDGKERKPMIANIGFMGIPLDTGEHEIELKFTPHVVLESLLISVLSICLALLLYRRSPLIRAVS